MTELWRSELNRSDHTRYGYGTHTQALRHTNAARMVLLNVDSNGSSHRPIVDSAPLSSAARSPLRASQRELPKHPLTERQMRPPSEEVPSALVELRQPKQLVTSLASRPGSRMGSQRLGSQHGATALSWASAYPNIEACLSSSTHQKSVSARGTRNDMRWVSSAPEGVRPFTARDVEDSSKLSHGGSSLPALPDVAPGWSRLVALLARRSTNLQSLLTGQLMPASNGLHSNAYKGTMLAGAICAAAHGDLPAVHSWLDNGGDVDDDHHGMTLLMAASLGGQEHIVKALLRCGATIDAKYTASGGRTALMASCVGFHPAIVQTLLESRASVHTQSFEGRRAIDDLADASRRTHLSPRQFVRHMKCTSVIMEHIAADEMQKLVPSATGCLSVQDEMQLNEWSSRVRERRKTMDALVIENARRGVDNETKFNDLVTDAHGKTAMDLARHTGQLLLRRANVRLDTMGVPRDEEANVEV